jgi:hypothetical protein
MPLTVRWLVIHHTNVERVDTWRFCGVKIAILLAQSSKKTAYKWKRDAMGLEKYPTISNNKRKKNIRKQAANLPKCSTCKIYWYEQIEEEPEVSGSWWRPSLDRMIPAIKSSIK